MKQYNTDLKKDENNVIKARLSYKDAAKWASEQQRKVEEVLNNVLLLSSTNLIVILARLLGKLQSI